LETESEINKKIMDITLKIQETHPELSNFLNEMPVTIPDEKKPHITISILKDYYDSLCNLLKKANEHS